MLSVFLQYAFEIFIQFCISMLVCIFFYNIFLRISLKRKQRSTNIPDVMRGDREISAIFLLTAIVFLGITIIVNFLYKPLIGFYLFSFFLFIMGLSAIFPNFKPKGKKIEDNCWVSPFQIDNFVVTLNDHKILIAGERLGGKPDHVIYKEGSPKWLPPHESELVSEKDYEYMLKAVLKFLDKFRSQGAIQEPGEHIGPYFTKEDMINRYALKGWKVERLPDGSTKVSPPPRKNLLARIRNRNRGRFPR